MQPLSSLGTLRFTLVAAEGCALISEIGPWSLVRCPWRVGHLRIGGPTPSGGVLEDCQRPLHGLPELFPVFFRRLPTSSLANVWMRHACHIGRGLLPAGPSRGESENGQRHAAAQCRRHVRASWPSSNGSPHVGFFSLATISIRLAWRIGPGSWAGRKPDVSARKRRPTTSLTRRPQGSCFSS